MGVTQGEVLRYTRYTVDISALLPDNIHWIRLMKFQIHWIHSVSS